MVTNWALGTDLAPSEETGRYLGISNPARAGAGSVGAGIGGPLADFFNRLRPGLGYLVIFTIYGDLLLLAVVALAKVWPEVKLSITVICALIHVGFLSTSCLIDNMYLFS